MESAVPVAPWTGSVVAATFSVLLARFVLKLVPLMVIPTPCVTIVGVNEVIVGAPGVAVTVNGELLVTGEPPDTETVIVPVVAPAGTEAVRSVFDADSTVPATPLNWMEFWFKVELNPDPRIVTVVPTGPLVGEKAEIVTTPAFCRLIERILPTAS